MWFGILGHLAVRRADGTDVPIPGPARRQLLAALLCRPGAIVSTAALVEDLWGSAPPRTAVNTLRSHVVRLRAALAQGGDENLLVTVGDGYRLDVAPLDVDAGRFEALVEEAGHTADAAAAIENYDRAMALWRDEPYVEFGDAPFAVLERIRLTELRALARERRTDLALATGTAGDLVGDLEQRVRAEPYRERGWEQLALALYRAGRQADALGACRRARQVLVDDLGVDPGPGLQTLEQQLLQQDPQLLASQPRPATAQQVLDRCPYLGLAGYEEQDAALFVGRERLTSMLAGRLADQSVVVVIGASGVGKSSMVRAGLVPALRAGALPGSSAWRVDVRTPGTALLTDQQRRPDLLVLDQAEELFTGIDPAERDDLVRQLARYVEDEKGRLVLVLRSDFYARLADVASLAPYAERAAVLVGPMRADELRRALVEPAARAGLRLEDELVETVMDDVAGQPEPLPLLSEAMVRTWERRTGDLLTLDAYEQAGELAGALEAAAEECYASLDEAQQHAARRLLIRLATRGESGWVRRPVTRSGVIEDAEQDALAAFIAARLVVADERRIDLAHEALLVHWPRLRDWLEERSLAADLLQHLDQAATEWRTAGRQDADLYRGPRLSAALDWRTDHPEELSRSEHEFLDASARAADAELSAARRQTRRLRTVAIGLAAVVLVAVAAAVLAVNERSSARTQAHRAERAALSADARRLAALSANAPDIATSSLLAVAAYRLQDSADTRGALLTAVERNQSALWRIQFRNRPQRVFATPDGSRIAVNDNNYDVMLINPRTRKQVGNSIPTIGFLDGITADGRTVVSNGPTNTEEPHWDVTAYDVASGKQISVLTDASCQDAWYSEMTTDGRWVAVITGTQDCTGASVEVYDSRDWTAPPLHFATDDHPAGFAAGRSVLAIEHADGSVEIRALPSLRVVGRLPATSSLPGTGNPLAVSPDGSTVARVDPADPRRAVLYRVRAGTSSAIPLPTQPQPVYAMQFAPDGSQLAVSSASGSLAVFATDGSQTGSYAGHAGPLNSIAWAGASDSAPTALYTVGLDGDLVSWDLETGPRTVHQAGADHLPPGRYLGLFGSLVLDDAQPPDEPNSARRIFTLDARTGQYASWPAGLIDTLIDGKGKQEGIAQISASANGTYATANIQYIYGPPRAPNRVEIYDMRTHRDVGHLALPHGAVFPDGYFTAVSPDGRHAYCNCTPTKDEVDVFALPSGKYLSSFRVRFAGAYGATLDSQCWRFDPAGRLIVAGWDPDNADERIALVDPAHRTLIAQTDLGDVDPPTSIGWSPDGRTMALGGDDGAVRLYDASTLRARTASVLVTSGLVNTVSFAPDGRTLLVAGTDGTVHFLNLPDLSPVGQPVPVGSAPIWAWYDANGNVVGLAPDSRPNTDGYRWFHMTAAPSELAAIACGLVDSDITRAQWQRYVGDRPYQHVCPATH